MTMTAARRGRQGGRAGAACLAAAVLALPLHWLLPALTVSPVAVRTYVALAAGGRNVGFVAGTAGSLVVDPPAVPGQAREWLAAVRKIAGGPIRWVVRTRPGPERTPLPPAYGLQGAVLAGPGTLQIGESRAEISTVAVHRGGDTIVLVKPDDVLFVGDLVEKNVVPDVADADTAVWARTLEEFLDRHPAAFFVGARGEPARALDVRYLRDYVAGLRLAVGQAIARGESGAAMADRLLTIQRGRVGHWSGFEVRGRRNIEAVERELSGGPGPARPTATPPPEK